MTPQQDEHLAARLSTLWQTIPTAARRRTARGRMRTCRELTDHLRRVRQLCVYATTAADQEAVDQLIAEIERRRGELSDGGRLAARVRTDRQLQSARRSKQQAEQLLRLLGAEDLAKC